jgi:hypothetical protein
LTGAEFAAEIFRHAPHHNVPVMFLPSRRPSATFNSGRGAAWSGALTVAFEGIEARAVDVQV